MSKQRKSDIKDNNISSKLLGTNISDINIQKFRDLTSYKKDRYELTGKFTIPILKTITNKFSSDVIFVLTLPKQAISSIQALRQCQNLIVLNLSQNSIEDITPLSKCQKIKIMDISQNSISKIDVLEGFNQLVNINLQGNLIKGLENLKSLQKCQQLKNVHLQSMSGSLQNPICSLKQYRENCLEYLSQIRRLDSIPRNVEFNNGSELAIGKTKEIKIDIKNIGPFYTSKFPSSAQYTPLQLDGENNLKKSISSCKSAIQELELKIRAMLTL